MKVHPGSPTRLSLILNYAIFQAEVMKNFGEAMTLLEKGQADSIDKVEEMDDEQFKESKEILALFKENQIIWKAILNAGKESHQESGSGGGMDDDDYDPEAIDQKEK